MSAKSLRKCGKAGAVAGKASSARSPKPAPRRKQSLQTNPDHQPQPNKMKPNQTINTFWYSFVLAAVGFVTTAQAQSTYNWAGAGPDLKWSTSANWGGSPGTLDSLFFPDGAFPVTTNAAGLVNNMVDSSLTVGTLTYQAVSGSSHFDTTFIPAGNTLTLGGNGNEPVLKVGSDIQTGSTANSTTIGGGGALSINDPVQGRIEIRQVTGATLNMAPLTNFTATVSNVYVGVVLDPGITTRPLNGAWLLAATNTITTAANPLAPGILIGESIGNGEASGVGGAGQVTLGAQNTFYTDGLVVGGHCGNGGSGDKLNFAAGTSGNVFTLRGSAGGSTPAAVFSIGDMSATTTGYQGSPVSTFGISPVVDFSGGTVDILAGTVNVGRTGIDDANPSANHAAASGSLLFENGTLDTTNLNIGYYQHTLAATFSQGTVTVRSNAVLTVHSNIVLAYLNTTNGMGTLPSSSTAGTLNVSNNAVVNVGGNIIAGGNTTAGGSGNTTVNLGGGAINMSGGGNVDLKNLNGFGAITNANNIRINGNLVPGTKTSAGTFLLGGNLNCDSNSVIFFNVGTNNQLGAAGNNDYIWAGGTNATFNNSRMLMTFGGPLIPSATYTLIDCSNATSVTGSVNASSPRFAPVLTTSTGVVMVVSANTNVTTTVTWQGQLGSLWDTSQLNTNWVLSGHPDSFYQLDNVVFDDTMVTNLIWPSGSLQPSSVTLNGNAVNFFFTNNLVATGAAPPGSIDGSTGITKNGTNTVLWGITNTFTGPFTINGGLVKLFDPTSTSGYAPVLGSTNAGSGPIVVNSGATLDTAVSSISPYKTLQIAGNGFNGMGALTNSKTSGQSIDGWHLQLNGNALIGLNGSPLTFQNPAQINTYGSVLNLNGYTLSVNAGASRLQFQQSVATNSGNINLVSGELRLNHAFLAGPGSLNISNGAFVTCAVSGTTVSNYLVMANLNIGPGVAAGINAGNGSSAALPFTIGSQVNLNGTLSLTNTVTVPVTNSIVGGGALNKWGNSNVVLSAANTYTGPTTINQGRFVLTNGATLASTNIAINSPGVFDVSAAGFTLASGQSVNLNATNAVQGNLTVSSGATLLGTGTNNGNVTVNAGGTLSPGPLTTPGLLAITSNLTLNAASLPFQFGAVTTPDGVNNDVVTCSNLNLTGTSTITISALGALVTTPSTPYTLFKYSGTLVGNESNLHVIGTNPRYTFTVLSTASTPGLVQVQISSTGSTLDIWKGGYASKPSAWDVNSSLNWLNGAVTGPYYDGDTVVFNTTGVTNGVDLFGLLAPASVAFSNNSTAYTLRGSGRLQAGTLIVDSSSTGGAVLANSSSNNVIGAGIILGAGATLTLNQPVNTFLTSTLNGSGTLAKQGANTLTVIGNSDPSFTGTNLVSAGTLKPAGPAALGGATASVVVTSGGTLDLNGQPVADGTYASGAGVGGLGAVNNTGASLNISNGLGGLILTGATTLGGSNRWDVGRWLPDPSYGAVQPPWIPIISTFNAQSNAITKVGTNDVFIHASDETYLADINVLAGRLVIDNPTWSNNVPPTLGYSQNTITVSNGATFGLGAGFPYQMQANGSGWYWGVNGGSKPLHLLSGGALEALGGNSTLNGTVTLETNTTVVVDNGATVTLAGNVQGPGALFVGGNGGSLQLSGNNTYQSNTVVSGGSLVLAANNALPTNSLVVVTNGTAGFAETALALAGSVSIPADAKARLLSGTFMAGDGTWNGPVEMSGSGCTLNGSVNGLILAGPIISSNETGTVTMDYDSITLGTALRFNGTVNIDYHSALSAGTLHRPILTLGGQNSWNSMTAARARINIRTNNALPLLAPISAGTLLAGVSDRTLIIDLGGYNQTVSSISAPFGFIDTFVIGNSSPTSDSILTYAGTGANSWSAVMTDDIDSNGGKTLGLNVTSGSLTLSGNSTYTGPTTVSGGTLMVNGELGTTAVTVSGSGTLGGIGTIGGNVTNAPGGTISPGIGIGTLTALGSVVLQSGSTCLFGVDNGLAINDTIAANGISYGGNLVVNKGSSIAYTNGQVLYLFSSSGGYSGAFDSIAVSGAAVIDASNLTVDGSIKVVTPTSPTPVPITFSTSGNQLHLSWPLDHTGWRMQSRTNITAGVWYDVPGSSTTNSITVTIQPSTRSDFFRMVYP